jgi:hypothetical protein
VASAALQAGIAPFRTSARERASETPATRGAIVFALSGQNVSITPMKVIFLILALPVLMCVAGCVSEASGNRSNFTGPPVMTGSDSNASENRY